MVALCTIPAVSQVDGGPARSARPALRYPTEHKDETRQRILAVASALFRVRGIGEVSIAEVMSEAGLTHGGFYRYFGSKEALVAAAMASAATATHAYLEGVGASASGGLEGVLRAYLRDVRRDTPSNGCIFSLLAADFARRPAEARAPFVEALALFTDLVSAHLPARLSPAVRQRRAASIFALMVGSMQLARLTAPSAASDALLEDAIQSALRIAREPSPGARTRRPGP